MYRLLTLCRVLSVSLGGFTAGHSHTSFMATPRQRAGSSDGQTPALLQRRSPRSTSNCRWYQRHRHHHQHATFVNKVVNRAWRCRLSFVLVISACRSIKLLCNRLVKDNLLSNPSPG